MNKLRTFLNGLGQVEQQNFAVRCGTTIGYLRKAMSVGQKIGESICIGIERETKGVICCEDIRPDVDWAVLRGPQIEPVDQSPDKLSEGHCGAGFGEPRTGCDNRDDERREPCTCLGGMGEPRTGTDRRDDERREQKAAA
jgi:DNA-binding transcriptional regulator YdaS (Cro superfamily)